MREQSAPDTEVLELRSKRGVGPLDESDADLLITTLIDLVSSGDHYVLDSFLSGVLIDVTKVYDERGFNLTHICS